MREICKNVVGGAGYQVSSRGRVRSVDRVTTNTLGVRKPLPGRLLKPWLTNGGHLQVDIKTLGRRHVHVLVLEAFVGRAPAGLEARHLNGKGTDNRWPQNLEWSSRSRNMQDKKYHGNTPHFTTPPRTAAAIKRDLKKFTHHGAIAQIAGRHGVHRAVVDSIKHGKAHRDV